MGEDSSQRKAKIICAKNALKNLERGMEIDVSSNPES
jgi:dsRNA-specific ribonuclease